MLNIEVHTIPYESMRYASAGDWIFEKDGSLTIFVADYGNWKYETLIAVHEIVEAMICRWKNVPQSKVDAFDIAFEEARKPGNTDEPGDDPRAPYRQAHFIATNIERIIAVALGVDWNKYIKCEPK